MHGNELARLRLCAAIAIGIAGCSGDDEGGADSGGNMFGNANESGSGGSSIFPGGGVDDDDQGSINGCADGLARTSRVTPRVILVVDGSCSMSTDYPASGQSATECVNNDGSRWAAIRRALVDEQNGIVARLDHAIEFGLVVFGTQPNCPLTADPINPGLDNYDAINNALGQVPPGMYTPTGPALAYTYENMIQGAQLDNDGGPEMVILATDGEPNSCGDANTNYQPSVDAVTASMGQNVTTYVISLANAQGEFHDHLSQLATLGGGPNARLYEPGTPEQLAADLELLIGGAVGCDVALNGFVTPGMECSGTVTLNGDPIACNDDDGWTLIDSRHIRLQGDACDQLMASASAQLEANFPCGVFMVD